MDTADVHALRRMINVLDVGDVWLQMPRDPASGCTRRPFSSVQSSRRLDRIYASHPLMWGESSSVVIRGSPSDHSAVLFSASFPDAVEMGPGLWRMPSYLPMLPEFITFMRPMVQTFVNDFSADNPGGWDHFKDRVFLHAASFMEEWRRRRSARRKGLMAVLSRAEEALRTPLAASDADFWIRTQASADGFLKGLDRMQTEYAACSFEMERRELDEKSSSWS